MKPTFVRVGVPKSKTRAPLTVKPPTESGNPASPLSNTRCDTDSTGTSHSWLIPSGRVSGDGLFVFINAEGAAPGGHVVTPPAGWTLLDSRTGTSDGNYVYWKVSDGTETDTTFTTAGSAETAFICGRIPANGATLSTPDIDSNDPIISTSLLDPIAVTPAAGAGTYHIVSVLMGNKGGPTPDAASAVSSGYTFLIECDVGGGVLSPHIVVQQKASTAVVTTEDPGTYAWSQSVGSRFFTGFTIAVAAAAADPAVVGFPVTASDIDTEAATDGQVLTSDGAGNAAWEDVPTGISDHGALSGLSDDDHTQYVLADGTRAFSGDQSMGSNKLTNVTDPTSAQDAATKAYVDSQAGSYELIVASTDSTIDRFVATADKTIANTTTETSLFGTGEGNLVFPSGFFTAGKVIRLLMRGRLSDTGTPNFTIKMKLGSTVIDSVGPVALTGISDVEWMLDGLITCRSVGAAGTFVGGGLFDYDDGSELSLGSGSDISVDTTASQTFDVTWQWGTASASNTITVREAAVTLIDPNRDGIGGLEPVFTEAGDDFVYGLVP